MKAVPWSTPSVDRPDMSLAELVASIEAGVSVAAEERPAGASEYGVLRVSAISQGVFRAVENKAVASLPNAVRPGLHAGDLLIARASGSRALVGAAAIVDADHPNLFLSDKIWRVSLRDNSAEAKLWLLHALRSPGAQRQLQLRSNGSSGMMNLSQKAFLGLRIPRFDTSSHTKIVPPLRVAMHQSAIADRLLAAKVRLKRGLLQRVFSGKGSITKWQSVKLQEFLSERKEVNNGATDLVLSCTKRGIVPQRERFAKRLASSTIGHYKIARRGDLVYDPMLLWDGSYGFSEGCDLGVVSPAYAVLIARQPANTDFLKALFETPRIRHAFRAISKGTNQRRRKAEVSDFLGIVAGVPVSEHDRKSVGLLYSALTREIELLQRLRMALEREKRGVIHRLLSGDLRLAAK